MKFALVFLYLFVLFQAYGARQLHDGSIKESFHVRPLFHVAVIEMVTRLKELWLPQSPSLSSSYDQTNYGRVTLPPPPPRMAPPKNQETYGRVNPSSPPPPNAAPSKGQETYGRVNPSSPPPPNTTPSKGQETYTRVNPSPPPPTNLAPSKGQETYGQVNSPPLTPDGAIEELEGKLAN
ncbi:hypothetical protein Hanom_Chr10g00881481 [Helianthus anomalus]